MAKTLLVAFTLAIAAVFSINAQEVERVRGILQAETRKAAEVHDKNRDNLAVGYLAELASLGESLAKLADKNGAEAVAKEEKRFIAALLAEADPFESVPELTKEDIVDTPAALRSIQAKYREGRNAIEQERDAKIEELGKKASERLAGLSVKEKNKTQAAAMKRESNRLKVAMQGEGFAAKMIKESKYKKTLVPKVPTKEQIVARQKKNEASKVTAVVAAKVNDLPAAVQKFLLTPLEYDKSWPPEITKWRYEGTGNYSHDHNLWNQPGQPKEFGSFVQAKTLKGYVKGTKTRDVWQMGAKNIAWTGRGAAWKLADSRDLVCSIVFHTDKPAAGEANGPAGTVAVYSIDEKDKLLASFIIPLTERETELYCAKHYSYNRLVIKKMGTKNRRGFTIPDHTPLRIVVGVVGYAKGEEADVLFEILPARQNEEI